MKSIIVVAVFLFNLKVYGSDSIPKFKISAGIGVPNLAKYSSFFNIYEGSPGYHSNGLGPFHLKVEYKTRWWLGVGVNANYMSYNIFYTDKAFDPNIGAVPNEVKISNSSTAINLRANFYFLNPEEHQTKSEIYGGFGIGYKFGKFDVSSQYPEWTPSITFDELYKLGFEATFGYRYNFNKHLAAYSEIGVAKSILQFGVTGSF